MELEGGVQLSGSAGTEVGNNTEAGMVGEMKADRESPPSIELFNRTVGVFGREARDKFKRVPARVRDGRVLVAFHHHGFQHPRRTF